MAALLLGWAVFALFLIWISYQPMPIAFYWQDPAEAARYAECLRIHDSWLGGPT